MSISFYQVADLQCPQCGQHFSTKVWLVVDVAERPDLAARCREGKIHEVVCPQGHAGMLGVPLLYHDRVKHKLILAVPPDVDEEQTRQINAQLVDRLRESLPAPWPDYLNRTQVVPQQLLPRALADDLHGPSNISAELSRLLDEIMQLNRSADAPRKIQLCEQALRLVQREPDPWLWAALHNELADALVKNSLGNHADNLEAAIHHYELALQVFTREEYPKQWAMAQHDLATAYDDRIQGKRADNLEEVIRHYELVLQVLTSETFPERWAQTQNSLAKAYYDRIRGERAENLEMAIRHYEFALQVYTREGFQEEWAMTQHNLANVYSDRIRGRRAENLEEAIRHYKLALQVRTREEFPIDWAMTQNNLATAYSDRIWGKRAENLEEAIRLCELALQVYTREAFPEQWAAAQHNLATAYAQRIRGERADNLEEAIRHSELALQVYTREAFPTNWAMIQHSLAAAYSDRIRGERAENLEEAVRHSELALQVRTHEEFPIDWAMTQLNLGLVYVDRVLGERAENLEEAIRHYKLALQVFTQEAFPELWAQTQMNLTNAYRNRIRGDRADNLEEAIRCCERALQVYTLETFPEQWAGTQTNLANAYIERIQGERAENLEEAIRHCEFALQVYTREAFPVLWATAQNNLANAYSDRIRGERADNLEEAIRLYELVLLVRTREAFPEQWATTQNNLATAYLHRIRGIRAENLEEAIGHYELALQVRTRDAFPEQWAQTQNNLASTYRNRIGGDRAENLEEAIRRCELALQVFTREAFPEGWAQTQNNLANAYRNRVLGERTDNLEEAIRHYELALQVRTHEAFPIDWAMTQVNLANAYAVRIQGESADNLEEALRHYELALQVYTVELWPDRARTTARNLASAAEARSDWPVLHRALGVALQAADQLFLQTVSATGARVEADELARLANRDIAACLQLVAQDPTIGRDVLVVAEAARSRAFLREIGLGDFSPPPDVPADFVARERVLLTQLREVVESLSSIDTSADRATEAERTLVARRAALTRDLEQVWSEMLVTAPDSRDYVVLRRGDTPAWDTLQHLATRLGQEAALVEFHNLEDRVVVIIWRAGWDTPRLVVIPLSQRELIQRYLRSYEHEIINRRLLAVANRSPLNDWQKLGEVLLAPLESALGNTTLVYFIPHGVLHLIPLHALTVNGEPFITRRAAAYAPSAAVLDRVLSSTSKGQSASGHDHILVMGAVFEQEAIEIAQHFEVNALVNIGANRAALLERASDASIIHLSCHGRFNSEDVLASAVLLSDGEFTARDWMRLRLNTDLVTLSACQLGISERNPGDDLVGMARALMYAGASSLLLTLWSVRADTTKDWVLDFYRRVWQTPGAGKSQAKAYAVREAMLALRAQNPDPFVWAPFVLIGDWR